VDDADGRCGIGFRHDPTESFGQLGVIPPLVKKTFAVGLEPRDETSRARRVRFPARLRARDAELARDRGNRNAGEQGPGNDVPFPHSVCGQAF
jgi:hypothetical protein